MAKFLIVLLVLLLAVAIVGITVTARYHSEMNAFGSTSTT
jgi:hypothetical protein